MIEKLIIIGSGPAAHTAAIYAARANLSPTLFEGFMAGGISAGGQLTTTTEIENFPGFPEGIDGFELTQKFKEQSLKFGTKIISETVIEVDFSKKPFKIKTETKEYECKCIIIATGATAKRLHVKGENNLWQKGISACAVCDGALPLFRNKPLVVVGGGDSAIEEASHLTHFGSKVYIVHRRNEFRASKIMQKRAFDNKKIEILWDSLVAEAIGVNFLEAVVIKNIKTSEEKKLLCNGLFYAVGHKPNTDFLNNQIELDETGYIKTKPNSTETSLPGIFAAGDVQDPKWRQAITAAGSGCMAALQAEKYISIYENS